MDRLFLSGLVDELAPALSGARIRSVALDRAAKTLVLTTSLAPPRELVLSWNRETPGLFRFQWPAAGAGAAPHGLKRWLAGAAIVAVEMSPLDRVVTLALARKRLSGKREAVALVLEVFATRSALYVVEGEGGTVVDVLASGASRLGPGERYVAPTPPPGAAPLAASAEELRLRLEALSPSAGERAVAKSVLLEATGATPLVVRELRFRMEVRGESAPRVFADVRREICEERPWLYASDEEPSRVLLSPLRLESEPALEARPMGSFSEAAATALRLELDARLRGSARQRVRGAVDRALDKTRRLERKLERELEELEPPEALRGRGERLLAGLSRARRSRAGFVTIPDVFDPEQREIDLPIDPRRSLAENAERLFVLARRSERARRSIEERLGVLARERAYWEEFELALEDARELEELEALAREARLGDGPVRRPETPERSAGPRRFATSSGVVILAGRSGRSNEEATFRLARPEDLWLHAAGLPGAHVVLKLEPGQEPSERDVEQAAGVAAYFSKGRGSSRVEVMVTERRNVSKIKGAPPGTVRLKSYRTLRVPPALPDSAEEK